MRNMKCRVVEFIANMSDGGAQALIRDYARLIDKEKFEMYIVTIYPSPQSANYALAKQYGAKVISLYKKYGIIEKLFNRCCGSYLIRKRIIRMINDLKPDCIHIHLNVLKYFERISKELDGIRLYYTCHNEPDVYFSGANLEERMAAKELICHNGLRLIALHDEMRNQLNMMFNVSNTVVVKNGIDIERFQNVHEDRKVIRNSLEIGEEKYVIGHVGRFSPQKNHAFLLNIFAEILKENQHAHLLLIGDGPMENEVKERIEKMALTEKVTILSHRSDIPRLLKAMDCFVFPSIHEGLPLSVVEAQAAGLKCVISNKITKECMLTSNIIMLPLEETAEKWAKTIMENKRIDKSEDRLDSFDMKNVISNLEDLYRTGNIG